MESIVIRNKRIIELFNLNIEDLTKRKILEMITNLEKFSDELEGENKLTFDLYFGICGQKALSYEEIANVLGCSKSNISLKMKRITSKFLKKIYSSSQSNDDLQNEKKMILSSKMNFLYKLFPEFNIFLLTEDEIDKLVCAINEIIDANIDDTNKFILKKNFAIGENKSLTQEEIAKILNISSANVGVKIHKGLKKILLELNERKMLEVFNECNNEAFNKREWIKCFFDIYNESNNDFYVSGVKNKIDKLFLDIEEAFSSVPLKFGAVMKFYIYLISCGYSYKEVSKEMIQIFGVNIYVFRSKVKKYINVIIKVLLEKELIYLDKKGPDEELQNNSFLFVEDRYNIEDMKMLDFLNSGVDVIGRDQYIEILNILKKGDFNVGSYNFLAKEIVIIYLCFGYFNNKFFTPMSVASFLSEEYSFVQSTILKYFDFYREGCSENYSEVLKRAFINVNK